MMSAIKEALSRYSPSSILSSQNISASVLVPLYESSTGVHVVLTKRTTRVKYHKGEISFPGGTREDSDKDMMDTALRECCEEVGIKRNDVEIIGRLDDVYTLTGFVITPYVGIIPYPYEFKTNPREVAYLITLPYSYLKEVGVVMETAKYDGKSRQVQAIHYKGDRIWGATCRMLLQFQKIMENGSN